jgi:hypothetical protein
MVARAEESKPVYEGTFAALVRESRGILEDKTPEPELSNPYAVVGALTCALDSVREWSSKVIGRDCEITRTRLLSSLAALAVKCEQAADHLGLCKPQGEGGEGE